MRLLSVIAPCSLVQRVWVLLLVKLRHIVWVHHWVVIGHAVVHGILLHLWHKLRVKLLLTHHHHLLVSCHLVVGRHLVLLWHGRHLHHTLLGLDVGRTQFSNWLGNRRFWLLGLHFLLCFLCLWLSFDFHCFFLFFLSFWLTWFLGFLLLFLLCLLLHGRLKLLLEHLKLILLGVLG
jgi:hypothetical protein